MAAHHVELLDTARQLLARQPGQRGRLSGARVRRSISTSYYALFSFLMKEVSDRIVGTGGALSVRRRMFSRVLTHAGLLSALSKCRGGQIEANVSGFFQHAAAPVTVAPPFIRTMAAAFSDSQAKRHDADYDMNASLSETDALVLATRVERAISDWSTARTAADRDFKHALCLLLVLKGKLRTE